MSETVALAIGIVQSVLTAPGVPGKKPKVSAASKPKQAHAAALTALPNAPGKAAQPQALNASKVQAAAALAIKPYLAKLAEAGFISHKHFLDVAADALRRMIADGTTKITMNAWIGTIFEIEGPKHPFVKDLTADLAAASIRFANDAIRGGRPVFIDGLGRVRKLPKKLEASHITEIYDLKVQGQKYCDRAFKIMDSSGNMFLILTQEFKTVGNKRRAIDEQQNARNVRLVDENRLAGTNLSYFEAGQKMPDVDLGNVLVHLENTESQVGIKASSRDALVPRTQTKTGKNQYKASYYYLKIKWPSREVRFVLQKVWNEL